MNYLRVTMYKNCFKRLIDFTIALLALLVLSPILIVVTICLAVANKGDGAFFCPYRPGKNGKLFRLIKFKSMRDAYDSSGTKLPDSERLTKVGRIIRLASIDELPQLINVLKGDMSFVGPRPLSATYLPYYNDEEMRRHSVLPGITGWAQVNGRKNITWEQKLSYDIYYVDHVSLSLDIKILVMTVIGVLKHKDVGVNNSGTNHFSDIREAQWAEQGKFDLIEKARKLSEPYWNMNRTGIK